MSESFNCNQRLIPAKLHYCWFGENPYSATAEKCIESWKKYAGDFEFFKWDETNCNLNENQYVRQAAQQKKWAFVSDYFRLKALYEHGGIYLDCDMELTEFLHQFRHDQLFFEFEKNSVAAGMIGATPHHPVIREILESYRDDQFSISKTIVTRITDLLIERHHLRQFKKECWLPGEIHIYPADVLLIDLSNGKNKAIHHYASSWIESAKDFKREVYNYTVWKNLSLHQKAYEKIKIYLQVYCHRLFNIMRNFKYRSKL